MIAIRPILKLLGLYPETPCATLKESEPMPAPPEIDEAEQEAAHRQWRAAIHKNRNLQQASVQLARRSTREWNYAESMAAKAIAEIQRKRDEDQ